MNGIKLEKPKYNKTKIYVHFYSYTLCYVPNESYMFFVSRAANRKNK